MNPFSHLDDKKLMNLYKDGESMAFDILYMRHKDKVYGYLKKRLFCEEVDDLFQLTFIKLHRSRELYDDKYEFLPWLYTISRSVLLDHFKKVKNRPNFTQIPDGLESIETDLDNDLDLEQFDLAKKEKEALELKFSDDLDYEEMAKKLNTSQANSRKIISRALAKMRNSFKGTSHE